MLGPIGAHIMSVLRVMTPSEIDRYANTTGKRKVTAIAAGAEGLGLADSNSRGTNTHSGSFKKMTDAEIIPIRPENEESSQRGNESQEKPSPRDALPKEKGPEGELEKAGIFSSHKIEEMRKQAKELARTSEDSSSVFLLKQRERLKKTNTRMVGNTALKTYAQTAHADMTQAEIDLENPDEELAQGSKGILINKKHF